MSFGEILALCLGSSALFSFVTYLLTLKITRQKGKLENESVAVDTLEDVIEQIKKDKEELVLEKNEYKAKYEAEMGHSRELMDENILLKQNLCVHYGCFLRKPSRGLGAKWFNEHITDETLGGDYLPLNVLLKNYGRNKQKIAEKAIDETMPSEQ